MKSFDICPVCSSERKPIFKATLLNKYNVSYCACEVCGLIQTEEPYWLDEAYDDAIALTDTGLVQRNIMLASKTAAALYFSLNIKGKCLDIAGGYGMLVRLMRDFGFDFYWEDKYCSNILAKGFEVTDTNGGFDVLTAFEVMEHVHDPIAFVRGAMGEHGVKTLIFSTQLYEYGRPPKNDWWYYSFETGQHVSFYTKKTLSIIADKLNLNFYSNGGLHIITEQKINPLTLLTVKTTLALPLAAYVRWRNGTKVMDDHYFMIDKLK